MTNAPTIQNTIFAHGFPGAFSMRLVNCDIGHPSVAKIDAHVEYQLRDYYDPNYQIPVNVAAVDFTVTYIDTEGGKNKVSVTIEANEARLMAKALVAFADDVDEHQRKIELHHRT